MSLDATCVHNHTMYSLCLLQNKTICYNPAVPIRLNVTLWAGLAKEGTRQDPEGEGRLYLLNYTLQLKQGKQPLSLSFDACVAMNKGKGTPCGDQVWIHTYIHNHKYLCQSNFNWAYGNPNQWLPCAGSTQCSGWKCVCDFTGGGYAGCKHIDSFRRGSNNKVVMELACTHPPVASYGFGIDGTGKDPQTYLTIRVAQVFEGEVRSLGWSVYNNLQKLHKPLPISTKANNLFIELAEEVAKTLMLKSCFVCGGTNMGEQWPWEAMEANPSVYNNLSRAGNITKRVHLSGIVRTLTTNLVGRNCFVREGSEDVGQLICLGSWLVGYQQWTSPSNLSAPDKFNLTFLNYLTDL
ncbi:endogenous retrovirus group 3 member 1 Env polyprotein-like [Pantherophis guttatus]|uniref:Endogenous retrovirus group 3 member 1 Env polyprotein-like n=1 Tax=Pantherophis guttatus TaxID=94885 RepID=A0A6P9BUJ4_PANGU|nr:endogenous retrovirus group 3 member 1 Env polyprotein-like [Pantherophis guttatus]XP_034271295.1 endogenous retrovirus group 3 member 1 Env polyprotein-like [Pantherophis guttatus]